ncbi:hypothetical protein KKD70_03900, partial [Patescibacteria group bacterium]|nr:hypothetical protein [Patescibacteria group bacterium]
MEESRNPANSQTMIGIGTIPPPPPPAEKSQPDIKGSEILSTPPPPPGWAPTQRDTIERAATISVPGFPVITPATPKRINSEQIETNQAVNQTMAFVNEPAKNDPAKKDPVESFPKTPIT